MEIDTPYKVLAIVLALIGIDYLIWDFHYTTSLGYQFFILADIITEWLTF